MIGICRLPARSPPSRSPGLTSFQTIATMSKNCCIDLLWGYCQRKTPHLVGWLFEGVPDSHRRRRNPTSASVPSMSTTMIRLSVSLFILLSDYQSLYLSHRRLKGFGMQSSLRRHPPPPFGRTALRTLTPGPRLSRSSLTVTAASVRPSSRPISRSDSPRPARSSSCRTSSSLHVLPLRSSPMVRQFCLKPIHRRSMQRTVAHRLVRLSRRF